MMDSFDLSLLLCFVLSYGFFYTVNKLVIHTFPRPKEYVESVADEAKKAYRVKRWKNIVVSFVHSLISSTLGMHLLIRYPELIENMIELHIPYGYYVHCFVFTYFFYDTVDNLLNNRTRKTYEMMIHHFLIIIVYLIQFAKRRYLGCVSIMLPLEVNSVFLHFRHILLHYNVSRHSSLYRVNAALNVITFIVFRLCVIFWAMNWMYVHLHEIETFILWISIPGITIFAVINILLLVRLIKSDYVKAVDKNE